MREEELRRREKEIRDQEVLDELLTNTPVCRIGMAPSKAPGYPYVVPVHFVHDRGRIYVHSARAGKKISMLGENSRVCVEMDDFIGLESADKACDYGTRYRSLIAFGKARIIEQREDKRRALRLLMNKYSGRSFDFSGQEIQRVAIIEIQLEEVTGKQG
jgi:nitroimidazol reductase NimA-like FMN-containing flavoprotein (pyridoxamine 5'-phosphate oxidase superfamily)